MSLMPIAAFTLIAAFANGAVVALIANRMQQRVRPAPVFARQPAARRPVFELDTIQDAPVRRTAPTRPDAPALCWGDAGISCEIQAAALLHQLGQARHERAVGDRLVA